MAEFNWPKPYLLELYQKAVEEGCLRIVLRGSTVEENDEEYASFKAAFYRLRRRRDGNYMAIIRPEYQMVQLKYERAIGRVLLIFSKLPDDQLMPSIESVKGTVDLPQPAGSLPHPTPEVEAEDFDADAHVAGLLKGITIEDEDDDDGTNIG